MRIQKMLASKSHRSPSRGASSPTTALMILGMLALGGADAWGQEVDSKQIMVQCFHQGRDALASEKWGEASVLFRKVSQECPGSPLALESNYYATLADWKRQDASCRESMDAWLREAKIAIDRFQRAQRPVPTSWDGWIANIHLLLAQSERQQEEWASAEQRLRCLLALEGSDRSQEHAWPTATESKSNAWYELGLLMQQRDRDWTTANECFQRALEGSSEGSELRLSALAAILGTQIQLAQWDQGLKTIKELDSQAKSDPWRTKVALLRSEIAKARNDAAAVSEALQGAVPWVLAGRTDLQLAYELALALLDARDHENGEAVMIHIIHRAPDDPIAVEACVRIAHRLMQRRAWPEARSYLDQAIESQCAPAWVPHARLARGRVLLQLGLPDSAVEDLEIALQCAGENLDLQTSIRFELGEALLQRQRWDDAKEHWEFLVNRYKDAQSDLPPWMARVWLHQAEMQALKQNWEEAEGIVSRIQSQFPQCDCRDDVDYIRARCLISKARFDEARQLLERIAREPTFHSPDLAARVRWMMGETFLMQRRYAEALLAYDSVLDTGCSSYWRSAAWMQKGQSHELLSDESAARHAYQTVLDDFADGPFAPLAQQKLDSLKSSNAPRATNARNSNGNPVVK